MSNLHETSQLDDYPYHPASMLFPLMDEGALRELCDDVREHGLRNPIVMHEGNVLDGRNRLLACDLVGVPPRFVEWSGDGTPTDWVISVNLKRRHLSESQRAMVAARLANLGDGQRKSASPIGESHTQAEAAGLLNVGKRSVERARKVRDLGAPELATAVESGQVAVSTAADLTELPVEEQAEIVARGETEILSKAKEIRQARTQQRRQERARDIAAKARNEQKLTGSVRYPVLYVDPPWRYEHAQSDNRAIENHYPTMAIEDIKALDIDTVAADDCVLFMWATSPKLAEALSVVKAWGFEYRTCLVWVKDKIGMGYYARQRHELLLVCRRGAPPAPEPAARPDSVIEAPREKHSKKPDVVYGLLETMYPNLPRIELFARQRREGWEAWGNEADAA